MIKRMNKNKTRLTHSFVRFHFELLCVYCCYCVVWMLSPSDLGFSQKVRVLYRFRHPAHAITSACMGVCLRVYDIKCHVTNRMLKTSTREYRTVITTMPESNHSNCLSRHQSVHTHWHMNDTDIGTYIWMYSIRYVCLPACGCYFL